MSITPYIKTSFWLSLGGTLFAGYLSAIKLVYDTCALREPCPYVWGYPACWYGFGLFLIMFIATTGAWLKKDGRSWIIWFNGVVSLVGVLFSGSLVWGEIIDAAAWLDLFQNTLGLPSCAYGLIVYVAILIVSWRALSLKRTK